MPLIDLGTRSLDIGNTPATYNAFDVRGGRTYLIYADIAIQRPNNVYSEILVRGRFNGGNMKGALLYDIATLPIALGTTLFSVDIPSPVSSNTDLSLELERRPFVFGTSDDAGLVSVKLSFETNQIYRTYRGGGRLGDDDD